VISINSIPRRARNVWPLIVVIVVSLVGAALWPVLRVPASTLGILNRPMIRELIYPTLGNPAIIKKGEKLTIEYDPREQHFNKGFVELVDFEVRAKSTNDPFSITRELPVVSPVVGYSNRWPEYGESELQDKRIYLVTVEVPRSLPEDLYDLTVRAQEPNKTWLRDTQPHALQAVNEFKDRFSFVQMTDIHVYGPECSFGSACYHLRSGRPNGIDPDRKGAVYYQQAIDQINLMKPDFCVFTGDFMFGESYLTQDQGDPWGWTTEYQYEMLWFYQETLKLDVPVFMTIGNHESCAEGDQAAHEDWFDNWRKLFGPLYYSFNYGDYHFLCLNAQDWSRSQRTLVETPVSLQPSKFKGQLLGGGDRWAPGVTEARLDEIEESEFSGQLAWIRDDLEAHNDSKMIVCAAHQDPWQPEGLGQMWANKQTNSLDLLNLGKMVLGVPGDPGDGEGRLALIEMLLEHKVSLFISGHFHSDNVDSAMWKDGDGKVWFVNTTSAQFQTDTFCPAYPGYRRIWVEDGKVESFNYKEPNWSYPLYQGTKVGKRNNLGLLQNPSIQHSFDQEPGTNEELTLTVNNTLEKPLPGAYAEFPMPYLTDGYYYEVQNGTFGEVYDQSTESPETRIYQVYADIAPRQQKKVRVHKSNSPDNSPPAGNVFINDGAAATDSKDVNLRIDAFDSGGSGVMDFMVSSSPDFKDARWEPFRPNVSWTLGNPKNGICSVYVRFRDGAMPPNVSEASQASIILTP